MEKGSEQSKEYRTQIRIPFQIKSNQIKPEWLTYWIIRSIYVCRCRHYWHASSMHVMGRFASTTKRKNYYKFNELCRFEKKVLFFFRFSLNSTNICTICQRAISLSADQTYIKCYFLLSKNKRTMFRNDSHVTMSDFDITNRIYTEIVLHLSESFLYRFRYV